MLALRSLLLASLCLLAGNQALADNALDNAKIRVGTAADYPPITFLKEGKVSGIEADLAAQLSANTGKDFSFTVMPWPELLPALERGEIDMVMSGMSVTTERAKQVDFSQSYMNVGQMAIIRVVDAGRLNSPTQLLQPSVRIGYVSDTTGAAFVQKAAGLTKTMAFSSIQPALKALMAGEIDAVVHDSVTSWNVDKDPQYASLMSLRRPLTDEHLAWAVSKQQQPLLQLLNEQLDKMKQDGNLNNVINTWIPIRVSVSVSVE